MIDQISQFFTTEMIYIWLNIGVIPFWLVLIVFPQSNICKYIVSSIFPILIFCAIYTYLIVLFFKSGYNFIDNFDLYKGLTNLNELMSNNSFLITFWIHFLAINLFCGSWIVRDCQKFQISKYLVFVPLLLTYFVGPLGIFVYWVIRIFFAKRISLFD